MKNIALLIRYNGTHYHGWQTQANGETIQGVISQAILRLTGAPPLPELHGVGRTDAGVHALHYIANFHTETTIPTDRLPYALKQFLPADISILSASEVAEDFHARFSCLEKTYCYRLYAARFPDPFLLERAYFTPLLPEYAPMADAAARIVGKHDFACFRASGSQTHGSVRTVSRCEVRREEEGHFQIICTADGFLYNMVRIIAGTLFYVGLGKLPPTAVDEMLSSGNRLEAGLTLPPHGLYLVSARYPVGTFSQEDFRIYEKDFLS